MLSLQGLDKFNSVCESIRYLEEKEKVVGLHPDSKNALENWKKERDDLNDLLFHDITGVLDELNTVKAASDVYDSFYKHLESFDYFHPNNNSCDIYDMGDDLPF